MTGLRRQSVHRHYLDLTRQALLAHPNLDLLIWPETMFRSPLVTFEPGAAPPSEWTGSAGEFTRLFMAPPAAPPAAGTPD